MTKSWVRSYDQLVRAAREQISETPDGRYEFADGIAAVLADTFCLSVDDVTRDILCDDQDRYDEGYEGVIS